jgi:hypothetical protein
MSKQLNDSLRSRLNQIQMNASIVGLFALALSAVGAFNDRPQFFFSYLFGWLFWLGLSLGCFAVTMIHHLTGGRWGYPTRRFLEAGFLVLPLMLVLFIPILFGLHELYPWARPEEVAAEKVLQQRHSYQNGWFFIVRGVLLFLLWILMSRQLRNWSLEQDASPEAAPTRKARALSGPGLVIYGLLGTSACVDWIMSLEKHWYSTMFGVIVLIGQILVAYAFVAVALAFFRREEPFATTLTQVHYHHLGNLLLTFVLFWTYVSFAQLLIVYSGDIPHELDWYLHRIAGNWKAIVVALGLFHFFIPFFLLLFRSIKRSVAPVATLAAMIFLMHMVQTYWLVMPALHQEGLEVHWLDFTAPIGIGGLWLAVFVWRLKAAPLLPQHDPGLQFAFVYGH